MFVLDFDDTLFDTHSFKKERLSSLVNLGVSEMLYWKTYKLARNNENGIITYTNEKHAKILSLYGFEYDQVLKALKETTSNENLKKFIFPGVIRFISFLKDFKQSIILLSLGQEFFQSIKVKGTGLDKYFDRTIFIDDTKIHVLKKIIKDKQKNNWFFNDKIEESQNIKKEFSNLNIVLKQAETFKEDEYKKSSFKYFKTWEEIQNYVKRNI